jgi:hypothetical protein
MEVKKLEYLKDFDASDKFYWSVQVELRIKLDDGDIKKNFMNNLKEKVYTNFNNTELEQSIYFNYLSGPGEFDIHFKTKLKDIEKNCEIFKSIFLKSVLEAKKDKEDIEEKLKEVKENFIAQLNKELKYQ